MIIKTEECRCPICGARLTIKKEAQNGGMDGRYYNWVVNCGDCHLFHIEYAADNFYGRKYYETPEAVMDNLKKYIHEVRNRIQDKIERMILYGTQQIGETEAVKPVLDFDGKDVYRCGNCGAQIFHPENTQADEDEKNYNRYCRKCGREVKWNDEEVDVPEWFIKNGEPDISVEVLGMNENGATRLSPEGIHIFKESEITRF